MTRISDKDNHPIAECFPASQEAVNILMGAPTGHADPTFDGRSGWTWLRLSTGELMLGLWPLGQTYDEVLPIFFDDKRAQANG